MQRSFWLTLAGGVALFAAGCTYSTRSGLPPHIKTVEVPMFKNRTFYKGLEGKLTRALIHRLNLDPHVRVVNSGGDATISGEIILVKNTPLRETTQDRPATMVVSIVTSFSFYDEVEQRPILTAVKLSSSQSSSAIGRVELDRGELLASAEEAAIQELAKTIARRTIGMW